MASGGGRCSRESEPVAWPRRVWSQDAPSSSPWIQVEDTDSWVHPSPGPTEAEPLEMGPGNLLLGILLACFL
jgi:hypothetical protein